MIRFACILLLVVAFVSGSPPNRTQRILGGSTVNIGEIPYQVALNYWNTPFVFAGGVLLNSRWILSTAHGLVGRPGNGINIILGTNRLDAFDIRQSSEIRIHPLFDRETFENDIGLVRAAAVIFFTGAISPIDLSPIFVENGETVQVSGYGAIFPNKTEESIMLRRATVTTGPCVDTEFMTFSIVNQFCAGGSDPTAAICTIDVGGPLVRDGLLVGIPFYHDPRACGRFLDGYLRITFYRFWILGNIPL